jgi:hypothetical protein
MLLGRRLFCYSGALSEDAGEADPASVSAKLKLPLPLSMTVHGE